MVKGVDIGRFPMLNFSPMKKSDVLEHFHGVTATASALSKAGYPISKQAISKWPDEVPELRARQIEEITGGILSLRRPVTEAA